MSWSYTVGPVLARDFVSADQAERDRLHHDFKRWNPEALNQQIGTAAKAAGLLAATINPDVYVRATLGGHAGGLSPDYVSLSVSQVDAPAPAVEAVAAEPEPVETAEPTSDDLAVAAEVAAQEPEPTLLSAAPAPTPEPEVSGGTHLANAGLGLTSAQLEALETAGYKTVASLRNASDDDLIKVAGIGDATIKRVREGL